MRQTHIDRPLKALAPADHYYDRDGGDDNGGGGVDDDGGDCDGVNGDDGDDSDDGDNGDGDPHLSCDGCEIPQG